MHDALTMIAVGMAVALPCVRALGKLLQSQLFGLTATDPGTAAALVLAYDGFAVLWAVLDSYR